jgi:hypothetical protein
MSDVNGQTASTEILSLQENVPLLENSLLTTHLVLIGTTSNPDTCNHEAGAGRVAFLPKTVYFLSTR